MEGSTGAGPTRVRHQQASSLQRLATMVTGRRYLLLTATATAVAVAAAYQRLRGLSAEELPRLSQETSASAANTALWALRVFLAELMRSRISAVIIIHFFLVAMYHAFLVLARLCLGSLRAAELQQTKETMIPFVLLRCQLLVSTMEPASASSSASEGHSSELGLLVMWLAALALLRALLALTQARFQRLLTRPMTQLHDLRRLGAVLGSVVALDIALAAMCSQLGLFAARIVHVPWFEASLLLLKTLELGVQVVFQSLDMGATSLDSTCSTAEDEEEDSGPSEKGEFRLLLLQTALSGAYLLQLVLYYLYVISVDQFRVSLFDLILILNVKNATVRVLEKVKQVKLYHQVVLDLDQLFPDATERELAAHMDDFCAICLKPMPTQAKTLRCGHLFHRLCLRQCLQKASVGDAFAGMDPLTRMANGLALDATGPTGLETAANAPGSASLRCPICRKHVCGGKSDERASEAEQHQPEVEDQQRPGQEDAAVAGDAADVENQQVIGAGEALPVPPPAEGGAAGATEEVLRFSTAFLSRWVPFPTFSFEIVRHRPMEVTPEMLQQIWEVFPQYSLEELHADLSRTRSVERTMERILNGRLDEQRLAAEAQRGEVGASGEMDAMAATGALGNAVDDLGEDFRWTLSTLATALWNPRAPRAPPRDTAATPVQEEAQAEQRPDQMGTETLLRRLARWRDQQNA